MIRTFPLDEIITTSFTSSLEQGSVLEWTIIICNEDCVDSQMKHRGELRKNAFIPALCGLYRGWSDVVKEVKIVCLSWQKLLRSKPEILSHSIKRNEKYSNCFNFHGDGESV